MRVPDWMIVSIYLEYLHPSFATTLRLLSPTYLDVKKLSALFCPDSLHIERCIQNTDFRSYFYSSTKSFALLKRARYMDYMSLYENKNIPEKKKHKILSKKDKLRMRSLDELAHLS